MKKLTAAALLLACTITYASAADPFEWKDTKHNFGTFNEDLGTVTCHFTGTNATADTIIVTDTRTTCGCTQPKLSTRTVAPGDTIGVDVTYNADGRPGGFDKRITLVCAPEGQSVLTIYGKVRPSQNSVNRAYPYRGADFRLQDAFVGIGNVFKGHTSSASLLGYNDQETPITPKVSGLPSFITAVCVPEQPTEGQNFLFSFTLDSNAPEALYGLTTDSITVYTAEHPDGGMTIPMSYIISEDFSGLTPEQLSQSAALNLPIDALDFGRITAKPKAKPIKKTVTLGNDGQSPLLIRRVYTADKAVDVSVRHNEIKPGKTEELTVTVYPDRLVGKEMVNARVNIITNTPGQPTMTLRVVGEVTGK